MDNESYKLLAHLASLEKPTLADCCLNTHQTNYNYLLEKGYIHHKNRTLPIIVTRSGRQALEFHERNERLLALQEQNTAIQNTLKNIQFFLAILTVVSILLQFAVLLRP